MSSAAGSASMPSAADAAISSPAGGTGAQMATPALTAAASATGWPGGAAGVAGGTQAAASALVALGAADGGGAAASGAYDGYVHSRVPSRPFRGADWRRIDLLHMARSTPMASLHPVLQLAEKEAAPYGSQEG